MKSVIVCGAGLAGLNAARKLKELGFQVKVVEKSDRPGGRVKTDKLDGFTLDHGFQVINPKYSELRETGALKDVEIVPLPKGVDIRRGLETIRVGDFRKDIRYLRGDISTRSGSLGEKLRFLKYLRGVAEDITFGDAMLEMGNFYEETLKLFLTGVFLTDPDIVSNRAARELLHWFIKGAPGFPIGGAQSLSVALSAGLDIDFGVEVSSVTANRVMTTSDVYEADAIVMALDPLSTSRILGLPEPQMNSCVTWYFAVPIGEVRSNHLRVGGAGPIVNSVALSNIVPSYSPLDTTLMAATSLTSAEESDIRDHLSYLWECDVAGWDLVAKYEIPNALPLHRQGQELVQSPRQESGIYLAGDWRNIPAQQGALLSGRLAALAIRDDLEAR